MYHHLRSKVVVVQKGADPLPHYDLCRMHMLEGRLITHQRMARCDKKNQMQWQKRDVAIADKSSKATFRLTGEYKSKCIEGVEVFKELGQLLDSRTTTGQCSSGTPGRRSRCGTVLGRCYGGRVKNWPPWRSYITW